MENLKNINPLRVDKTTIINLEKGKLPPQVLELEEAVLGAMMIDKKGVDEVIDIHEHRVSRVAGAIGISAEHAEVVFIRGS